MADIKSAEDVRRWRREEIEDVLHSNFISFDTSAELEELIEKLRLLWMRRQRLPSKMLLGKHIELSTIRAKRIL